jgi:hypothetical protein
MTSARRIAPILAATLLVACALLLVGCSSSSGPTESDGYLEPTSAANVYANFWRSYNERNVDEFLDCLSEDFRFYFTEEDQQGWPQLPPWFYRADERQVHENMFGDDWGVEFISLTLTTTSVETIPGAGVGRPTGDVVIIQADCDLRLVRGDWTYLATDPQEFRFRMEESGGRARWEMFEWYDMECACGRVEAAGWGGIKYSFLEELSQQARRTSPAEVIDQLEAAYIAMDLEDYLDCLSEDFIFYPAEDDVHDPNGNIPPEWYKATEDTIHTNMFDPQSNVSSISLVLTNTYVDHDPGDPQDPLDDVYVHREDVDLRVLVEGWFTYLATAPSEFHLRVDPDEEGPYGEVMWEVYEWYDDPIHGGTQGREDATWGGIKWLYR